MIRRQLIGAFVTSAAMAAGSAFAETSAEDNSVSNIVVSGRYTSESLSTPQHALPLVDTPQSVTAAPGQSPWSICWSAIIASPSPSPSPSHCLGPARA